MTLLETLLVYERSMEFRKMGLQAVHSIAVALQDSETPEHHLQLLMNDRIVSHIFERHILKHTALGRERDQENIKLRGVAIDVMVTILEVANSLINSPINKDRAVNVFIEKLYTEYQLFDILVKNIIAETGVVKINIQEFRLAARALSLMPQHVFEILNPLVLNKPMPRQKQDKSAVSIENYVKAVQIMVKTFSQSQNEQDQIATYFALYSMFLFMSKSLKSDEIAKKSLDGLNHENSMLNQLG